MVTWTALIQTAFGVVGLIMIFYGLLSFYANAMSDAPAESDASSGCYTAIAGAVLLLILLLTILYRAT